MSVHMPQSLPLLTCRTSALFGRASGLYLTTSGLSRAAASGIVAEDNSRAQEPAAYMKEIGAALSHCRLDVTGRSYRLRCI